MVVLGFRPKITEEKVSVVAAVAVSKDTPVSEVSNTNEKYKKKKKTAVASFPSKNIKSQVNRPAPPISVSSNWKRLKALKVFKSSDIDATQSSNVKTVSDAEWFGVKDVQEFAAGREDQLLRENVSIATLFPPVPTNMSTEKMGKPCKFIALDCEMVGTGLKGFESILARVSVVNFHGIELMDVYVRPTRKVTDYRTAVSGVTAAHLTASREDPGVNLHGQPLLNLQELQERLVPLLEDRIVVGHALNNDFSALLLSSNHPRRLIRDTSRYTPFRALSNGRSPSLKMLAARILGVKIQSKEHDSVDDARIAMLLYRAVKSQWENSIFTREDQHKVASSKTKKSRFRNNKEQIDDASEDGSENIFNAFL